MVASLNTRFRPHISKHASRMTEVVRGTLPKPPIADAEPIDFEEFAAYINRNLTRLIAMRLDTSTETPRYPTPIMKQIDLLAKARSELRFGNVQAARLLVDRARDILDHDETNNPVPTPIFALRPGLAE